MIKKDIRKDNFQEETMAAFGIIRQTISDIIAKIPEFETDLSSFGLVPTKNNMKNISTDGENFVFNPGNVLKHYEEDGKERLEKEILHPFFHYLRNDHVSFASTPYKDTVTAMVDMEVTKAINILYGKEPQDISNYHSDDHELWRFNKNKLTTSDDYDELFESDADIRRRSRLLEAVVASRRRRCGMT